jgi:hypothetical protein
MDTHRQTLENLAIEVADKDANTHRERSRQRRISLLGNALLAECAWTGLSTKCTPCHDQVFDPNAIFCKKHHNEAKAAWEGGTPVTYKYSNWDPEFDPQVDNAPPPTRPLEEFVKSPESLKNLMNSDGYARFKKAYIPNLVPMTESKSASTVTLRRLTS